jgi:Carboxypeptidase regulatory-like domain
MKARTFVALAILALSVWVAANLAQGAYQAHQNDQDVNRFLSAYQLTRPTRLNDCVLCHPGGGFDGEYYGSCDYCHVAYGLEPPHGEIPLNSFGSAYLGAGRTSGALKDIEGLDSDGDSHTNGEEIRALSFPGDAEDYPGLTVASSITLDKEEIQKLAPSHKQFLLLNATRQGDFYAQYEGAKVRDLLESVGLLPEATRITVFSPDGFSKTFYIEDPEDKVYDVMGPYPRGRYYSGLDFVEYPALPAYAYGQEIPDELHMLLAYERQGGPLEEGRLELSEGRLTLEGEGPFRLVVPQKMPGRPDRSVKDAPQGDIWDYDKKKDHNAGFCVRSVTAIRVEPLPEGTADFNWFEGGWKMVNNGQVVIYGAINPPTYPVTGDVSTTDGSPLEGVQVSVGDAGSTTSSAAGDFHMDLPVGKYTMIPSKGGYVFQPQQVTFSLSSEGYSKSFVGYEANDVCSGGYIRTSIGTPVSGVKMKVRDKKRGTTDTNGQYFLSVVGGTYRLRPRAKGFDFDPESLEVDCTVGDAAGADFVATDKKGPKIRVIEPRNGFRTTDSQLDVSSRATDNFVVQGVTWENGGYSGVAELVDGDDWTALVDLQMGKNKIIFTAVDEEGNSRSRKLKVIRK